MNDTQPRRRPGIWSVWLDGQRSREIGGAPGEDEAMNLADDERRRLALGWSDPDTPWEVEADGTRHASLRDGRELVCEPPC